MSHCIAGQEDAIVTPPASEGYAHNSSGCTESSIKRKKLGASVAVSQPFAHHFNSPPRSLLTLSVALALLQSGVMSAVGLSVCTHPQT